MLQALHTLCTAIRNREVKGAIELRLYEINLAITNAAAGSQIHTMGKGQEAIDLRSKTIRRSVTKHP